MNFSYKQKQVVFRQYKYCSSVLRLYYESAKWLVQSWVQQHKRPPNPSQISTEINAHVASACVSRTITDEPAVRKLTIDL